MPLQRFRPKKKPKAAAEKAGDGGASQASGLGVEFEENNGVIYPEAERRLAAHESGELRVGINCCAVCAAPEATQCNTCGKVAYCSAACLERDAPTHARVCAALAELATWERSLEGLLPPSALPPRKELEGGGSGGSGSSGSGSGSSGGGSDSSSDSSGGGNGSVDDDDESDDSDGEGAVAAAE